MDVRHRLGLAEAQQIVVARQLPGMALEPPPPKIRLREFQPLHHSPHGPIKHQNPPPQQPPQPLRYIVSFHIEVTKRDFTLYP